MKKIYKLTLAALAFVIIFTASNLKAQDSQNAKIGLTVGLDYISNYIYRGMYYNQGDTMNGGMFSPYVSYNVLNTGLTLGIRGEMDEKKIWNSKDESLYYEDRDYDSINFNINYMYNLKEAVTFNLGSWYCRNKTLHNDVDSYNPSYFDFYFSARVDAFPLTPMLAVTYSYFTDNDFARGFDVSEIYGTGSGKNGDLYVQLGISHSFELDDETYLDLDAIVGWYDKNAYEDRLITPSKSNDISDIDLSAGLTTTVDMLTFSTSFHYVIVPGTQYKYLWGSTTRDIHKFYAKLGVSCSI